MAKVGIDMLHNDVFERLATFVAFFSCRAGVYPALNFRRHSVCEHRFSTPNSPVTHIMAVTEELVTHIVALLLILWPQNSKNKLLFLEIWAMNEPLPRYGSWTHSVCPLAFLVRMSPILVLWIDA